jgi:hypothetical protein
VSPGFILRVKHKRLVGRWWCKEKESDMLMRRRSVWQRRRQGTGPLYCRIPADKPFQTRYRWSCFIQQIRCSMDTDFTDPDSRHINRHWEVNKPQLHSRVVCDCSTSCNELCQRESVVLYPHTFTSQDIHCRVPCVAHPFTQTSHKATHLH